MALDPFLLEIVICPENQQGLALGDADLKKLLNARIDKGKLKNRAGRPVEGPLSDVFVRKDKAVAYPVRNGTPVLLVDEAIPLDQLG